MKRWMRVLLAALLAVLLAVPAMAIEVTPMEEKEETPMNLDLFDVDMLNKWLDEGGRSDEGYIIGLEDDAETSDENRLMMTWDIRKTWYLWEVTEDGITMPAYMLDDVADMNVTFYDGGERTGDMVMRANGNTVNGVWHQEGVYVTITPNDGSQEFTFMVNGEFKLELEWNGMKMVFAEQKREPQPGDPTMDELIAQAAQNSAGNLDDARDAAEDAVESIVEPEDDDDDGDDKDDDKDDSAQEAVEDAVEDALENTDVSEVLAPEDGVAVDSVDAFNGTWKLTGVKVMGTTLPPETFKMDWTLIIAGGNVAMVAVTGDDMDNDTLQGSLQNGGLLVSNDEGAMLFMLNDAGQLVTSLGGDGEYAMELVFNK